MKTSRNESCPCGSGKKYKKCCGNKDFLPPPNDCATDTVLDTYMLLVEGIMAFGYKIARFDKDGKEFKKTSKEFEKRLKPGTKDGINNSLYIGWLHFDYRFGVSKKTITERFIESEFYEGIHPRGQELINHLADSYCAFYEIDKVLDDWVWLNELGTGNMYKALKTGEPFEKNAKVGEVWYMRLVGTPDEKYSLGDPYVFGPEAKNDFYKAMKRYEEIMHTVKMTKEDTFREFCRRYTPSWAEYITRSPKIMDK